MTELPGHINPEREAYRAFRDMPQDAPVDMLNLIRLPDWANDDDARRVSGADAHGAYREASKPVLLRLGARQIWLGAFELTLVGPREEHWDIAFIARYPTAAAFLAMLADPDYREAVKHRSAAVLDSQLIRFGRRMPGPGFGELAATDNIID